MVDEFKAFRDALHQSEAAYENAMKGLSEARTLRAKAIAAALEGGMSLRDIASEIGMTSARVQQIFDTLWTHRVGFVGQLSEDAALSLHDSGIALRFSSGAGVAPPGGDLPAPYRHGVYVVAANDEEAEAMVKGALADHGNFSKFEVTRTKGKRDSAEG